MSATCRLFILVLISFMPFVPGRAQVPGCKDPYATNYNAAATVNDGSCLYSNTTLSAVPAGLLSDTLNETSGLVYWNGLLWTHNDDTDPALYGIDTTDGHIVRNVTILNAINHDWEEITQDNDYFYVGDFGNNGNGNRQDLVILRVAKNAITAGQTTVNADKIFFSYQDQTSFAGTGNNNTNFDCEAFIATSDSLYLFTKQWVSQKSRIYAVPKLPGTYTAWPQAEYNTDGLITGATYLPAKKTIVLTGYKIVSPFFQPFVLLLYDYTGNQFFSGNKRKVSVNPPYHQTEAIATRDGRHFFISNEKLSQAGITIPARLQKLDLSSCLDTYYQSLSVAGTGQAPNELFVYPNPAKRTLHLWIGTERGTRAKVTVLNAAGQIIVANNYQLHTGTNRVDLILPLHTPGGLYQVRLDANGIARQVTCMVE